MKIIQIINQILPGDGVSSTALVFAEDLSSCGIENVIYARNVGVDDPKVNINQFVDVSEIEYSKEDVLLYHLYDGMDLNEEIKSLPGKKVLFFNNVTPPKFYEGISGYEFFMKLWGEYSTAESRDHFDHAITMSEFSKKCLISNGWEAKDITVIPFVNISKRSDSNRYGIEDPFTILFVGRMAPNKKIEDIISCFALYKKEYYDKARLILIGSKHFRGYSHSLSELVIKEGVSDVQILDHISDEELIKRYETADIFLCMSEHEGLCIPVLEAMSFDVPVIAYDSTAVSETVGDAGVRIDRKDFRSFCESIDRVRSDTEYRSKIIESQRDWLAGYEPAKRQKAIVSLIDRLRDLPCRTEPEDIVSDRGLDLAERILDFSSGKPVVLYGYGYAGKKVYSMLQRAKRMDVIEAICDNGKVGERSEGSDMIIEGHDECVKRHPDDHYLISIQDRPQRIIERLYNDGIKMDRIILFDMFTERLI